MLTDWQELPRTPALPGLFARAAKFGIDAEKVQDLVRVVGEHGSVSRFGSMRGTGQECTTFRYLARPGRAEARAGLARWRFVGGVAGLPDQSIA